MGNDYDAIIIGAGHNGLVCAGYLAKAGLKVIVFEQWHKAGGCVQTEELIPNFQTMQLGIRIIHVPYGWRAVNREDKSGFICFLSFIDFPGRTGLENTFPGHPAEMLVGGHILKIIHQIIASPHSLD